MIRPDRVGQIAPGDRLALRVVHADWIPVVVSRPSGAVRVETAADGSRSLTNSGAQPAHFVYAEVAPKFAMMLVHVRGFLSAFLS